MCNYKALAAVVFAVESNNQVLRRRKIIGKRILANSIVFTTWVVNPN